MERQNRLGSSSRPGSGLDEDAGFGVLASGPAQVAPSHWLTKIEDVRDVAGLFDQPFGVNFYLVYFPVLAVLADGYLNKGRSLLWRNGYIYDLLSIVSLFEDPGRIRRGMIDERSILPRQLWRDVNAEGPHYFTRIGQAGYNPHPVDEIGPT